MAKLKRVNQVLILLGILLVPSIFYLVISSGENNYEKLTIFGPREPVAGSPGDTLYHTIPEFTLTSHTGKEFNSATALKDKIFVAEFFFATCPTICPKMTMQMKRLQEKFKDEPEIVLLSFTVDPARDTVAALEAYASQYGVDASKWNLLTGDKKVIYDLARHGFFLAAMDGDGGEHDFIHSEKLVLIDKDKRIRGYYDGTDYENVNELMDEILVLKWEYKKK